MPNWCSNQLVIIGSDEVLDEIEFKGEQFKFQNFVPMPQEIREVSTGMTTINGEKFHYWKTIGFDKSCQNCAKNFLNPCAAHDQSVGLTELEIESLNVRFGTADWMDWAIDNWGTKWDIDVEKKTRTTGQLALNFDTAWSPPEQFCLKMSNQYNAVFSLSYCEIGADFWGHDEYFQGIRFNITEGAVSDFIKTPGEFSMEIADLNEPLKSFLEVRDLGLGG